MIQPLEYTANLTLPEAEQRFKEVEDAFNTVKSNYTGLRKYRRNIKQSDNETLCDCIGVLLPLMNQKSVMAQALEEKDDLILYKAANLTNDIGIYLARFKNTGVSIIKGPAEF
jgi:hypothetical protein